MIVKNTNYSKLGNFLKRNYKIKGKIKIKEIKKGTQNSNLLIKTKKTKLVLTISETNKKTYKIYSKLHKLRNKMKYVPGMLEYRRGRIFFYCNRKISFLSYFIKGKEPKKEKNKTNYILAGKISEMHNTLIHKGNYIRNNININSVKRMLSYIYTKIVKSKKKLIFENIIYLKNQYKYIRLRSIPKGICHCDIFPDNVLISKKNLYILDFHLASIEPYIYDICIYINEWCFKKKLIHKSIIYFIIGYIKNRKIKKQEFRNIYLMLITTSFRFWATRISDKYKEKLKSINKVPYRYFYINSYLKFKREKICSFFYKLNKYLK
ncbi:phosphotransferase [Candidatus Vidania fulgoroideorum]